MCVYRQVNLALIYCGTETETFGAGGGGGGGAAKNHGLSGTIEANV